MFGISGEHLLILGIVLLIFGPKRLPELGNTLGKGIRNFKDAISGVEEAKFRRVEEERKAAQVAESHAQHVKSETVASADPVSADPLKSSDPSKNDPNHT